MTVPEPSTIVPRPPIAEPRRSPRPREHRSAWALQPAESRPVAAVRLPGALFEGVAGALREAGLAVFDIHSQQVGPAPLVLVLELPADVEDAQRLLTAGACGPGRVLLMPADLRSTGGPLRPGLDEVVELPCHPLQVTAAALRVGGAPEWQIAGWSERAFSDVWAGPAGRQPHQR